MRLQLWIQLQRDASAIIPRSYFSNYKCLSDEAKMATMRAEVEMRKTRVHTGFHEDAERKRRLRHSERAHSRPNNPETWARRVLIPLRLVVFVISKRIEESLHVHAYMTGMRRMHSAGFINCIRLYPVTSATRAGSLRGE